VAKSSRSNTWGPGEVHELVTGWPLRWQIRLVLTITTNFLEYLKPQKHPPTPLQGWIGPHDGPRSHDAPKAFKPGQGPHGAAIDPQPLPTRPLNTADSVPCPCLTCLNYSLGTDQARTSPRGAQASTPRGR
jgi:hypothetical protein